MSVLEVNQLYFKYGRKTILEDVTFSLDKGDIVGLVGSNGAGKTTLMKIISGILPGATGKVTLKASSVGALIEEPALYPHISVLRNLQFYCRLYGQGYDIIDKFKDDLDVAGYLNKKASKLSLGMRQRVGLFIALIASNEFILLDEPTNGLDPKGINNLLNLIKDLAHKYGITFVVSSHILANLDQVCNKNFMIANQRLTSLDDGQHAKYSLYSFDTSPKDLLGLLDQYQLTYEHKGRDILVTDPAAIEAGLASQGIDLQFEKVGLSEVIFNED